MGPWPAEPHQPSLHYQGQVQGGLRSGIRIAQGSYFRVTLLKATPVQVDGEPWVQAPGHMIISAAGPKVPCAVSWAGPEGWLGRAPLFPSGPLGIGRGGAHRLKPNPFL